MLAPSTLAVVARNVRWQGSVATEPYECGWAREAVFFLRALDDSADAPMVRAHVEISPDGVAWVAEGTSVMLPIHRDETTFCRVEKFGGWLRLAAELPAGTAMTVLVALHLKG